MKRSHTNTRQETIKRHQRIYTSASRARGYRHLDSGRKFVTIGISKDQLGKKRAHDLMRRLRKSWTHLRAGYSPRPDGAHPFEICPPLAKYGTYKAIGLRLAYVTEAGAHRLGLIKNQVVSTLLVQRPRGDYSSVGVFDISTGRPIARSASTTFDFAAWHPDYADAVLVVISNL